MVIFLDCSTELNSDRIFLLLSFAIGTVAFALVSFIAALFSRRAIRPFQEAMQKQQQFLEDAGHELKTPLAIISANNDVLELTDEMCIRDRSAATGIVSAGGGQRHKRVPKKYRIG